MEIVDICIYTYVVHARHFSRMGGVYVMWEDLSVSHF